MSINDPLELEEQIRAVFKQVSEELTAENFESQRRKIHDDIVKFEPEYEGVKASHETRAVMATMRAKLDTNNELNIRVLAQLKALGLI